MSAGLAYEEPGKYNRHTAPIPDSLTERRQIKQNKAIETMLDGFYGYCEGRGLNAQELDAEDSPTFSTAAHMFVHGVASKTIEKLREKKDTRTFHIIPIGTIEQRMRDYYRTFGTNRREKVGVARDNEIAYLAPRLRTLGLDAYDALEPETDQREARTAAFPEIELAEVLHESLLFRGNQTAADGVEVLLAAYGDRFMHLSQEVGVVVVREGRYRDNHNIIHPGS